MSSREVLKERFSTLLSVAGSGYSIDSLRSVQEHIEPLNLFERRELDFYGLSAIIETITPSLPHLDDPSSEQTVADLVDFGKRNRPSLGRYMRLVTAGKLIAQGYVRDDVHKAVSQIDPTVLFVSSALKASYIEQERPPEDMTVQVAYMATEDPNMAVSYVADTRLTMDGLFGGSAYALGDILPDGDMKELRREMAVYRARVATPEFLRAVVRAAGLPFADLQAVAGVGCVTSSNVVEMSKLLQKQRMLIHPEMPKVGCPARANIDVMSWSPRFLLSACEALTRLNPKRKVR